MIFKLAVWLIQRQILGASKDSFLRAYLRVDLIEIRNAIDALYAPRTEE